ncbi:hypothetical protein LBMAG42_04740 [Deltaproteobacteria bacterium]|nr:hypothetical protein LBMAG42_04740 [Deltaproteobacteria bacterium]
MVTLLIALLGCTPEVTTEATEDVRVDHAKKDVESTLPRTCMNEEGRLFVVWQDERDKYQAVWFNMSSDGGKTFLGSDTLLSHGKGDAANPVIACAGDFVYVAWEDKRDGELGYSNIYLQYSTDAGRHWQDDDLALDADPEGDFISQGPSIAAAGDSAWVAWADDVNGAYDIYLNRTGTGGDKWLDEPLRIDGDDAGSAYSANPRVEGDNSGHVVIAWEDRRNGNSDIYVNASTDGGKSFPDDDRRLDGGDEAGSANSFSPTIAMSGENVYVVWQDERYGDNADILLNYSHSAGDGWKDEALRVESDAEGIADSRNADVAADGDKVWVAFQDDRTGGGYDVFLRWSEDGGKSWASEVETRMETDDNGAAQSYYPKIAINGDLWGVAWLDYRDDLEGIGFNDLYYQYTVNAGADWQTSDVRINSTSPATSYAVDHSFYLLDDAAVTVWADGRGGSSDVFAASRALGVQSVFVAAEGGGK